MWVAGSGNDALEPNQRNVIFNLFHMEESSGIISPGANIYNTIDRGIC